MSGFDNEVLNCANVDFSGTSPVSGQINQDGELLIGAASAPNIRSGLLTGSGGITITNGPGTIDIDGSGASSNLHFNANVGTAIPAANAISFVGTGGAATLAIGSTVTINLANIPNSSLTNSAITLSNGTNITVTGSPVSLGGAATIALSGQVAVANGGTSLSTLTAHALYVGNGTSAPNALAVGATGTLLVGATTADPAFGTSATGDFTFTSATAAATRTLTVSNTDNTNTASTALIQTTTGGASAGDPLHTFTVSGATSWSIGIDNSVSDTFVMAASTALGTTNVMSATTGGAVSFVLGNVDVTKSSSAGTVSTTVSNTSNTGSSNALQQVTVAGTSAGDAFTTYTISGTTNWAVGTDNSDSDAFVIASSATLGTTNVMRIANGGETTFPLQTAFLAYLANQAANKTGAGTSYTLGTDALTEIYDVNSDFNTNGTFTAPVTGKYFLQSKMRVGGITAAMTLGLYTLITTARNYQFEGGGPGATKNGSNTLDFMINQLVDMTAGDTSTVTIKLSNGAGDVADIDGNGSPYVTWFSGNLEC